MDNYFKPKWYQFKRRYKLWKFARLLRKTNEMDKKYISQLLKYLNSFKTENTSKEVYSWKIQSK